MSTNMATLQYPTTKWAQWASLDIIPLSIISDNNPDTPELSLVGELPVKGGFGYSLTLDPKFTYHFSSIHESASPEEIAFLADPSTGEIFWANSTAQETLGFSMTNSSLGLALPQEHSVVLVVSNPEMTEKNSFNLEVSADMILSPAPTDDPVFRFAKLSTGTYFYTASIEERDQIINHNPDFRFEGSVFVGDNEAREGFIPVSRFANLKSGSYFYTANQAEIDSTLSNANFRYEGTAFYAPAFDSLNTEPVYRLQNPQSKGYLFTTNPAEKAFALLDGWNDQGIAFYSEIPNALETSLTSLAVLDIFAS